jgi:flagellar export protein FliJ
MKRYRFTLGSVLRVRKVEEDQAIMQLAEAERARAVAAEASARRESAHRAALRQQHETTTTAFLAHRERLERTANAVRSSHDAVHAAEAATVARRAAVAAASAAVNALENLDERRRAEHALELQREEAAEIDDLVTGRHRRGER